MIDMTGERFRAEENNFTNLIASLVRIETNADISIINTGAFRYGDIIDANSPIKKEFIIKNFPFVDDVIVTKKI